MASCLPATAPVYPQRTYQVILLDGSTKNLVYAWCTAQAAASALIVRCYDRDYAYGDPLLTVSVQSMKEIREK